MPPRNCDVTDPDNPDIHDKQTIRTCNAAQGVHVIQPGQAGYACGQLIRRR